jgi:uncharacterized phage protein (TIGR01671 family)
MSREIKFRVWDDDNKKFIFKNELFSGGQAKFTLNLKGELDYIKDSFDGQKDPNYLFQQFTGLTDKNGAEIYEGDIVQFGFFALNDHHITFDKNKNKEDDITTVIWQHSVQWDFSKLEELRENIESNPDVVGVQIIGNIFQNPELLTK